MVRGTQGYRNSINRFVQISQSLNFFEVCKDFVGFLPAIPARILDVGSGAGQNAAALADMNFSVTAVEPIIDLLHASQQKYKNRTITWLNCSLPLLDCLVDKHERFDFILVESVWHHLNEAERSMSMNRFAALLNRGAKVAISMRDGPAGMGTCVYPTNASHTIKQFENMGFTCILFLKNQPSMLKNKENVIWSRVVLQKN